MLSLKYVILFLAKVEKLFSIDYQYKSSISKANIKTNNSEKKNMLENHNNR